MRENFKSKHVSANNNNNKYKRIPWSRPEDQTS